MRYIVIERARKQYFPRGIKGDRIHDEEFLSLWEEWSRKLLDDESELNSMRETIEENSQAHPEFFWDWYVVNEEHKVRKEMDREEEVYYKIAEAENMLRSAEASLKSNNFGMGLEFVKDAREQLNRTMREMTD